MHQTNKMLQNKTLGKSDTNGKIYKAEVALRRFGLQPASSSNEQSYLPWLLSKDDIQLAAKRLRHIRLPAHIDCNPQYLFSNPSRLKSHDWKQVYICSYTYSYIHKLSTS